MYLAAGVYLYVAPSYPRILFLPLWDGEVGKIFISTAWGSTSGGTRSFLRKNLLKHCIHLVKKHEGLILTRSLEWCILNVKRSKIPRSLLPGSARSTPNPKTNGSTPILIVKTMVSFSNHVNDERDNITVFFDNYFATTLIRGNFTLTDSLYWFFQKYRQFPKFGCLFAPIAK